MFQVKYCGDLRNKMFHVKHFEDLRNNTPPLPLARD